jgi:molecular chaperone GrpE (heat shock protein)
MTKLLTDKNKRFLFEETAEITGFLYESDGEVGLIESDSMPSDLPSEIYPLIRAITGNKVTRNSTYYPREELIGNEAFGTGLISFLKPYEAPVLLHHMDRPMGGSSLDTDPLGRVIAVKYIEPDNPAMGYSYTGERDNGYLAIVPRITDPLAIKKISDERYKTVSIGCAAENVYCSICGPKLSFREHGQCDHEKGAYYNEGGEERMCYYVLSGLKYREISFVNIPSDNEAQVYKKDMGKKGVMAWAKGPNSLTTLGNESANFPMQIKQCLEGFKFAHENKEGNSMTFTNIEDIKANADKLMEMVDKGETPDEELVKAVAEAIDKAGLSTEHITRVVISDLEGVPFLNKEFKEDEEISPIAEFFAEEGQKEVPLSELSTLFNAVETYIDSLRVSVKDLKTVQEEKDTKIQSLESELKEWQDKAEAAISGEIGTLQTEIENMKTTLAEESETAKKWMTRSLAVELIRAGDKLAKGKTLDQLTEQLSSRSVESILDRYMDAISDISNSHTVEQITNITKVGNPANENIPEQRNSKGVHTSIENIRKLWEKNKENFSPTGDLKPVVIEDDPETLDIQVNEGELEIRVRERIEKNTINFDKFD